MSNSTTNEQSDVLAVISLLAGPAQAGAKGILAQTAFNFMKASEAVVRARKGQLSDDIQNQANEALQLAQKTFLTTAGMTEAVDEGRQDIINNGAKPFTPSLPI